MPRRKPPQLKEPQLTPDEQAQLNAMYFRAILLMSDWREGKLDAVADGLVEKLRKEGVILILGATPPPGFGVMEQREAPHESPVATSMRSASSRSRSAASSGANIASR